MSANIYKGREAFALKYAEKHSLRSSKKEIHILKKASIILRRRTLKFMKDNPLKLKDLRVAFGENQQQFTPELTSFMEGVLFIQQKLVSEKSKKREILTGSVASSVM